MPQSGGEKVVNECASILGLSKRWVLRPGQGESEMNNVSSFIDGALATGGLIVTLIGSVWALVASNSIPAIDAKHAEEALKPAVKKAA
jgi:hypothetical protein